MAYLDRRWSEAYYALRNSFIPLWTLYISNPGTSSDTTFDIDVPAPFRHESRRQYDKFFERYGTHYIKSAWLGGKAMLAFTIAKSSEMTKEEIQAGLKASFGGFGSGSVSAKQLEHKERLQNNSECTVFGNGGDELKLAALSSLDETKYNEWLATINANPQVIEFEAVGIWTLISDKEKAQALMDAYREATVFTPIKAVFLIDTRVRFMEDEYYYSYDMVKGETTEPKRIREEWPILSEIGFERGDASFFGKYLRSPAAWEDTHEHTERSYH